jgi:predicted amidophosphoribosyltransferase
LSTADSVNPAFRAAEESVKLQRNYLRNPLPAGSGICAVCRSDADSRFELCYQCGQHSRLGAGRIADAVVPIAYSLKGGQHDHHLIVYKSTPPSAQAQFNLAALGLLYLSKHWQCLTRAAGGPLTYVVTVPSTKGRAGTHPLESTLAARIGLPILRPTGNSAYSSADRDFHRDRFLLPDGAVAGDRVLLLDDTWTTGGRVQSLAFAAKTAGASAVVAVVLGRRVNPEWGPSASLVERLRAAPLFDISRCGLDDPQS